MQGGYIIGLWGLRSYCQHNCYSYKKLTDGILIANLVSKKQERMMLICVLLLVFVSLDLHAMDQEMVLKDQMSQKPKLSFGWIVGDVPDFLPSSISRAMGVKERCQAPITSEAIALIKQEVEARENNFLITLNILESKEIPAPAIDVEIYYTKDPVWDDIQPGDDKSILMYLSNIEKGYKALLDRGLSCSIIKSFHSKTSCMPEIRAHLQLFYICLLNYIQDFDQNKQWRQFASLEWEITGLDDMYREHLSHIARQEETRTKKVLLHYCILNNRIKQGRGPWSSLMCIPELDSIVSNYLSFNSQQLYQIVSTIVLDDEQPQ